MTTATTPGPGRPRDGRVDAAVTAAVRELLGEHGYAGTTVARIAERAGVGRGALYRRWSSKAELVFASLVHPTRLGDAPDTGSLHGDLAAIATIVHHRLSDAMTAAGLAGIAVEVRDAPELRAALDAGLFAEERRWMATVLERAQRRGELRRAADPELVRRLIIGPIALAALYTPERPTDPLALASIVTRGLTA